MMRTLCLDYGEKRIGLALSDPLDLTAQSRGFLSVDKNMERELLNRLKEWDVSLILLGLPLNRAGEDTKKTLEVRSFKEKLETLTSCNIQFWDERYSTVAANKHLIAANVSRKKRKTVVDSQAAVFILQGYLDYKRRGV